MSFPNIPDINPDIDVTFEDAINLLLVSIALEEISLSQLLDAETCKILHVLDNCRHKDSILQDAIDINKSVDHTIKDIIKLQMLLQFKLENITEIIPTTTTSSTTTTSTTTTTTTTKTTSTTTTTHTTTCTTSTRSTTTRICCECPCSIIGRSKGHIANKSDDFFCQPAVIQVFAFSCDFKNRSLRYCAGSDDDTLHLTAIPSSIKLECPCSQHPDRLVLCGNGQLEIKSKCALNVVGTVSFVACIWDKKIGKNAFQMVITSKDKKDLIHDSGPIHTKSSDWGFRIQSC